MFGHESGYGRLGICATYDTKSPGNVRTSSTHKGETIQTPRGEFQRFPTWVLGWNDMAYRLVSPDYPYVQQNATTLEQIIPLFAPSSDSNDPESYIADVLYRMNRYDMGPDRYASMDGLPVVWIPAPLSNYGGPHSQEYKWIVIHDIEGSADSGVQTLSDPGRQASVQFINDPQKNRVVQMLGTGSEAWGAGNDEANTKGLHIENPGTAGQPYPSNVAYNCGRIAGVLARDFGIPVRRITTAEFQAGVPGFLGHGDVKPQHGPQSNWHTDPGPTWDWNTTLSIAAQVAGGTGAGTQPGPFFHETGFGVLGGILGDFAAGGSVSRFGYPRSWEYDTVENGVKIRRQWFERGCAEWIPNRPDQPDVTWALLGSAILDNWNLLATWQNDRTTRAAFTPGNSWADAPNVNS
jgi:hypothetical protein